MALKPEDWEVIDHWYERRRRRVKVSQILYAEPEGIDFIVKFDCECRITFRGDYGQRVTAKKTCNHHAKLPPHSPILLRMYADAVKQRDHAGMAFR